MTTEPVTPAVDLPERVTLGKAFLRDHYNLDVRWRVNDQPEYPFLIYRFVSLNPGPREVVVASGVGYDHESAYINANKALVKVLDRIKAVEAAIENADAGTELDDPIICEFLSLNDCRFGTRWSSAAIDTSKAINDPKRMLWPPLDEDYDLIRVEVVRAGTFEVLAEGYDRNRRTAAAAAFCDLIKTHRATPIEGLVMPGES